MCVVDADVTNPMLVMRNVKPGVHATQPAAPACPTTITMRAP